MTPEQSLIASALFVGFFVIWFWWGAVGDDFICWIGGKDNLSGWVQAVGAIIALFVTAYIARLDGVHRKKEQNRRDKAEIREIKFHLFKTSFWNAFVTYISIYRGFAEYKGNIVNNKDYFGFYVLLNTIRHFDHLFEVCSKMSDEDKYILQISEIGEDFTMLLSEINMINNRYEVFLNSTIEALNYEKNDSFSKFVKNNKPGDLKFENDNLIDIKETLDSSLIKLNSIYTNITEKIFGGGG